MQRGNLRSVSFRGRGRVRGRGMGSSRPGPRAERVAHLPSESVGGPPHRQAGHRRRDGTLRPTTDRIVDGDGPTQRGSQRHFWTVIRSTDRR